MFGVSRLFAAFQSLAHAVEALRDTALEINARIRGDLVLDDRVQEELLEGEMRIGVPAAGGDTNGRARKKK